MPEITGYSALTLALALPEDGRLLACDISVEYTRVGRPFWARAGVAHKIELVLAPAVQTLDARLAAGEADTLALQALNAKLHHDEKVDLSLLPIGDALTLARKR